MDNPKIQVISLNNGLWDRWCDWFLDVYFSAVEQEIQKGASHAWRRVDRTRRSELKAAFQCLLSRPDEVILQFAFMEDEPIGYFLGLVKECVAEIPAKVGYINGLYVDPSRRRLGVASRLLESGLRWFQTFGIFHYELYVALRSDDSRIFWEKKGFSPSEQVMNLSLTPS